MGTRDLNLVAPVYTYIKIDQIVRPAPSMAAVVIDQHEDSIDDGAFYLDPIWRGLNGGWLDFPAMRHNRGTGLGFADGHVELRKWQDPRTYEPVLGKWRFGKQTPHSADIEWIQDRLTARVQ